MDDDSLMAAVARGDHVALREVFTRHAPWLAARLRRLLPADAVEDVLQETFIGVWRGAGGYQADGRLGVLEGVDLLSEQARWATLRSVRAHGSHLFLRYAL